MRKRALIFLGLLLGAIVLSLLGYWMLNLTGAAAWAKTEALLRAEREPLLLSEIIPPPVPDRVNLGTVGSEAKRLPGRLPSGNLNSPPPAMASPAAAA